MQGGLSLLPRPGMHPRHPQALFLAPPTPFLPSCKTPLLLTQVSQARVVAFRIRDLLAGRERRQIPKSQVNATTRCVIGSNEVGICAQKLT